MWNGVKGAEIGIEIEMTGITQKESGRSNSRVFWDQEEISGNLL